MRRNHNTNHQTSVTRFALGQTFITPGAEEALQKATTTVQQARGDLFAGALVTNSFVRKPTNVTSGARTF